MASLASFLLSSATALALVQSIEAWLPPFFQGFNTGYNPQYMPGFNPGYNPYIPSLPFVPGFSGFSGGPPPNYDENRVIAQALPGSAPENSEHSERRPPLQDSSQCFDPSPAFSSSPTPFFSSPFSGLLSPVKWLFKKWPITWNMPPETTHYYNTGNGNGWSKLKTWSWSF